MPSSGPLQWFNFAVPANFFVGFFFYNFSWDFGAGFRDFTNKWEETNTEQIERYFNVMAVPVGRLSQLGFKIIASC